MLEELEVRNLGPIAHAVLTPGAGMTAITGETGAGKSMLLDALRLICGAPAQGARLTAAADEAWVQGIFRVDDGSQALAVARDAGVQVQDGELFLTRAVPAGGRSRAVLCGRSVPRAVLGEVGSDVVVIHGQADQLRIASAVRQRDFLDMVADNEALIREYAHAWEALRAMDDRLAQLSGQEASARQRADYLRESIARIDRVAPRAGEDEELKARRSRIENAADIAVGVGRAVHALDSSQIDDGSDAPGATQLIGQAIESLRSIRADGPYAPMARRLGSLNAELADVVFSLGSQDGSDGDEGDLDAINARIHELAELTRRWGPSLAEVLAWRDQAALDVQDLDDSPQKVAELTAARRELAEAALDAARRLSASRSAAAAALSSTVSAELSALAMSGARLDIEVRRRDGEEVLDAHGMDDVEFLFTPYPGAGRLPMGRSASGGELSRLMLALELAAADARGASDAVTFIFDEVDAGVGGRAAVELGRRLARLARRSQVIVVTHLAQVASWAGSQFVVSKCQEDDAGVAVSATVRQVSGSDRVEEIARMLSGGTSRTSLIHAEELLADSVVNDAD